MNCKSAYPPRFAPAPKHTRPYAARCAPEAGEAAPEVAAIQILLNDMPDDGAPEAMLFFPPNFFQKSQHESTRPSVKPFRGGSHHELGRLQRYDRPTSDHSPCSRMAYWAWLSAKSGRASPVLNGADEQPFALGTAWPAMFQKGPSPGPPAGAQCSTVGYGLMEPFALSQATK